MAFHTKSTGVWTALAGSLVGLAALGLANYAVARQTERRHPPKGTFITVDGVRLHYTDRGEGSPIVLIHGNAVMGDDWDISGVSDLLLQSHRVIIFDRPGFGYSERSHGRVWTADQQADLLHLALEKIGVERPVVVGHSWGAIVALAYTTRYQANVRGLVLLSGYYFWTVRPDVPVVAVAALPVIGYVLRYTISPLLGWLQMPLLKWQMFSPTSVPKHFRDLYSTGMALRPTQIRATAEDGALMVPGALALRGRYEGLTIPVVILAGDGDKVVFPRGAKRLATTIQGSVLRIVAGAGHMIHHVARRQVVQAIEDVAGPKDGMASPTQPTYRDAA